MRTVLIAALVLLAGQSTPVHPNFSGEWTLAQDRSSQTLRGGTVMSVSGLLGSKFTATQDSKTIELVITVPNLAAPVRAVYNLDGSESRNMNPQGPGVPDEPIFSRVSWEESRLVIRTKGTILVDGKPTESRRVIWLDAGGLLTIERSSEGQPTTRSVYQRVR